MKKFRYLRNKTVLRSVCAALVFFLVLGTAPLFKAHAGTIVNDVPLSNDGSADITLSHSPGTVKVGVSQMKKVTFSASSSYIGSGETYGNFEVTNASLRSCSPDGFVTIQSGVSGVYVHQNGLYLSIVGEEMGECDITVNLDVRIQYTGSDYENTPAEKDIIAVCGINYTIHVEVTAAVSVEPSTLSMKVGDAASQLTATVIPNTLTAEWKSSNAAVATVDSNGNVTPVGEGTAKITASAGGGSASCVVTVTNDTTSSEEPTSSEDPSGTVYTFTANGGSTWKKGSGEDMGFTVTKTPNEPEVYTEFGSLELDGEELVRDTDYTATQGSILITLKADKLETLSEGSHTLKVNLTTGNSLETTFTVSSGGSSTPGTGDNSTPETGENSLSFVLCALLMFFSLAGFVFVFYKRELQINE